MQVQQPDPGSLTGSEARDLFDSHHVDDDYVAKWLKDVAESAIVANPKTGEYYEDHKTRLSALKEIAKLRRMHEKEPIYRVTIFQRNGWKNIC